MNLKTKTSADTIAAYIFGSLVATALLIAFGIFVYEVSKGNFHFPDGSL